MTWLGNPIPFIKSKRLAEADLLISSDNHDIAADNEYDLGKARFFTFNTGTMFWRPTEASSNLLRSWKAKVSNSTKDWMRDQPALNILLREDRPPLKSFDREWNEGRVRDDVHYDDDEEYKEAARKIFTFKFASSSSSSANSDDSHSETKSNSDNNDHNTDNVITMHEIQVSVLPISLFTNGHLYFVQQSEFLDRPQPLSVHTTYQFGDSKYPYGKRQRLRDSMIWYGDDDKQYYTGNDEELFMVLDESIQHLPPTIFHANDSIDSRDALQRHFEEDRYRRRLMLDAASIAYALNRTLILPKSMCYCDKTWFAVTSCWPFYMKRSIDFPFVCPLDHIFNVESLMERQTLITIKEYSYLSNPRTAESIKSDQVSIEVRCGSSGRTKDYVDVKHRRDDNGSEFILSCGLTDVELRNALESISSHRVLRFKSVSNVLCSFTKREDQAALDHFAQVAMKSPESNFCSTEQYREIGRPRQNEASLIVRHCGFSRNELLQKKKIFLGQVRDDPSCACEFGMNEAESWSESRKRMYICDADSSDYLSHTNDSYHNDNTNYNTSILFVNNSSNK